MRVSCFVALAVCSSSASAQWNPPAAQWGKVDPADLRVMTWNVRDALCSTNVKTEGNNNWCACARVVAALRPDVLFLAETGDNDGNGTGTNVDSVTALTMTLGNFLHGGNDSFHGNSAVTAYVQKYAAAYDLPYVFVSSSTDGFNRNCVLSRYPFADLNGDTKSKLSDIPNVSATAWAPGGNGGIRGFMFAEIDLPSSYAGNFVFGGAHLKAGSGSSDHTQRITAAENVSYVVRYWLNGNGASTPDPSAKIADSPAATQVLDANTPVVLAGDWNEDELLNTGAKGPVDWLARAQTSGGTSDGTDRDGTDMTYDTSVQYFTGNRQTIGSTGTKFDYVAWQDSVAALRISSVFDSAGNPANAQPAEITAFSGGASSITSKASDHRPVIADFVLPSTLVDCNANGIADATDIANGTSFDTDSSAVPDECEACPNLIAYCTAGTTTNGCNATMSASGTPSVSATSGFTVTASNVEGQKTGLLFYGISGPKASPWAPGSSSFACVKSPTQRTPSSNTAGTSNACDGALSIDFLDYLATHASALGQPLGAGDLVWWQAWFRDPPAPNTTNLSNGMQVLMCP